MCSIWDTGITATKVLTHCGIWIHIIYSCILGRNFRAATTAVAAVPLHFDLLPLKKFHALLPQWPLCPACTYPALYNRYFAIFSCASFLSLLYFDNGLCYWDSDLLLVKHSWKSKWWVWVLPWYEPLETTTIMLFTSITAQSGDLAKLSLIQQSWRQERRSEKRWKTVATVVKTVW